MTHEQADFWDEVRRQLLILEVYVATPELLNAEVTFDRRHAHEDVLALALDCSTTQQLAIRLQD